MSATEMPNRIEIRLASSAIPIHRAATVQICSILTSCEARYSRIIRQPAQEDGRLDRWTRK
jgi:hypothetical protein